MYQCTNDRLKRRSRIRKNGTDIAKQTTDIGSCGPVDNQQSEASQRKRCHLEQGTCGQDASAVHAIFV